MSMYVAGLGRACGLGLTSDLELNLYEFSL